MYSIYIPLKVGGNMPTNTLAKQKRLNNIVSFVKENIDFFIAPLENQEQFAPWIQAYPEIIALSNQLIRALKNSTRNQASDEFRSNIAYDQAIEQLLMPKNIILNKQPEYDPILLNIFERYKKQQHAINDWRTYNYVRTKEKLHIKTVTLYNAGDTLSKARAIAANNVLTSVDKAYKAKGSGLTTKQATHALEATTSLLNNPTKHIQAYQKHIKPFTKSEISEVKKVGSTMLSLLGISCLAIVPIVTVATAGAALPIAMGLGVLSAGLLSAGISVLAHAAGKKKGTVQRFNDASTLWKKSSNIDKLARDITCSQVLRSC